MTFYTHRHNSENTVYLTRDYNNIIKSARILVVNAATVKKLNFCVFFLQYSFRMNITNAFFKKKKKTMPNQNDMISRSIVVFVMLLLPFFMRLFMPIVVFLAFVRFMPRTDNRIRTNRLKYNIESLNSIIIKKSFENIVRVSQTIRL